MTDANGPTPLVTIIGSGPVGVALAGKLTRSAVPVAALYGRTLAHAEAAAAEAGVLGLARDVSALAQQSDVAIIAVSDRLVAQVAQECLASGLLGRQQIVLHTCGAWSAAELLGALVGKVKAVGAFHPLASMSSRVMAWKRLEAAHFGVQGEPAAVHMAERLVNMMGGTVLSLSPAAMPLYHAGAAITSNLVVAVVDLARRAFEAAGIPAEEVLPALLPLLRGTADNLEQYGLPAALTGPIARGDVVTVQRHLQALACLKPDVVNVYGVLGLEVLAVAAQKGSIDGNEAARLRALLSG